MLLKCVAGCRLTRWLRVGTEIILQLYRVQYAEMNFTTLTINVEHPTPFVRKLIGSGTFTNNPYNRESSFIISKTWTSVLRLSVGLSLFSRCPTMIILQSEDMGRLRHIVPILQCNGTHGRFSPLPPPFRKWKCSKNIGTTVPL